MLSREGFCKALRMIRDQESIDEQFSKALNLVGNGHFVFGTENKYLLALRDVLKEAVNDQYDYIDWWLYEAADDFEVWETDCTMKYTHTTETRRKISQDSDGGSSDHSGGGGSSTSGKY